MSDKHLTLGQRVMVVGKDVKGSIAYVGYPTFATGKWIGVILDEPKGKNNGTVRGHAYFRCEENYGVFVRQTQIMLLDAEDNPMETSMTTSTEESKPSNRRLSSTLMGRRVSYNQLEQMWEFLNSNKALATGHNKTSQSREFSKRMWKNIAQKLNSHRDGAKKDWIRWSKYWNDYKSKLRKLASTLEARSSQNGGESQQTRALTEIEHKFLLLLGPSEEASTSQHTVADNSDTTDSESAQNDSTMCVDTVLPATSRVAPLPSTTRPPTIPTRRRRRNETQDATRRALIRISERRAQREESNNEILKLILEELREIKEILRSRGVEPRRDDGMTNNEDFD